MARARRPFVAAPSSTPPKEVIVEKEGNVLRLKIPAQMAATLRRRSNRHPAGYKPFELPDFPPSVKPAIGAGLAMDEADGVGATISWAASSIINSAYAEGQVFLGYAQLSLMAQRAEYRKITETIATEATREWITLKSTSEDEKGDKIKELNDLLVKYQVQQVCRKALEGDGFFGRGHIYIALRGEDGAENDDRDELGTSIGTGNDQISKNKVRKNGLVAFRNVEAVWCYPTNYNSTNPLAADWYRPKMWQVMGTSLDRTRLLTIVSREVPDIIKPAYSFGGLSLTQMSKPYVDNFLRTRQSISDLVHSFSVMGLKTNLQSLLTPGGQDLIERLDFFNVTRDNHGAMLLDKETEELFNVTTPLSTLDALQAQSQEQMAAVAGIPIVKLLGITPSGLNASSDGEIRVFYDSIHALQENTLRAPLTTMINFIQLSKWGEVDPEITFEFDPLWQLDDAGNLGIEKTKTDIDDANVAMGSVSPEEVRQRLAGDPKSIYHGLDLSEPLPEPEPEVDPEGINPSDPHAQEELSSGASPTEKSPDVPKPRDPVDRLATVTTRAAFHGIGSGDAAFSKSDVRYECPAKGEDHCGECTHFVGPIACKLVTGEIDREGWCEEWDGAGTAEDAEFEESKHPRDDSGKFGSSGGGASSVSGQRGELIKDPNYWATPEAKGSISNLPENRAINWKKKGRHWVNSEVVKGWHGTSSKSADLISRDGLKYGNIALSPEYAEKMAVVRSGLHEGSKPVVLEIDAPVGSIHPVFHGPKHRNTDALALASTIPPSAIKINQSGNGE